MPYIVTQSDTNNDFDWTEINTTYNDDDIVTDIVTDYDNGTHVTDHYYPHYSNGYFIRTQEDLSDLYDWTTHTTDFRGQLGETFLKISIVYDTGVIEAFEIFDDVETYYRIDNWIDGQDLVGSEIRYYERVVHPYAEILQHEETLYADGILYEVAYLTPDWNRGERVSFKSWTDTEDAHSWSTKVWNDSVWNKLITETITYDDGFRNEKISLYDGTLQEQRRDDGEENGGRYNWSSTVDFYNSSGVPTAKYVNYDDGAVLQTLYYGDGDRHSRSWTDPENARNFSRISISYDNNDLMSRRDTSYDNGVEKTELWEDGARSQTIYADHLDVKPYTSQLITYDANGLKAQREITYDNGVQKVEKWEDGARTETTFDDVLDVKSYRQSRVEYDADGEVEFRFTKYDSGNELEKTYEDGEIVSKVRSDSSDQRAWTTVTSEYEDGELDTRTTVYDDGNVKVEIFGFEDPFAV